MAKKPTPVVLTPAQEQVFIQAALTTWNEIGYGCLAATAEDEGRDINRVLLSRDMVIELVVDADRLRMTLVQARADAACINLIENQTPEGRALRNRLLRRAFPHGRYGM